MRLGLLIAVPVLGCPLVVAAADFWQAKAASEWTTQEGKKMRTRSPWAKTATVDLGGAMSSTMRSGGGGRGRGGGPSGSPGMADASEGGMGGTSMERGMQDQGVGRGGSLPPVIVRWESAEPELDALEKVSRETRQIIEGAAKQYYIVSATGMNFRGGGGQNVIERLAKGTKLLRKGKDPIVAVKVQMARMEEKPVLLFLFPRTSAIDIEDKDVEFQTAAGPMSVKVKFALKDMQYKGKLAI